MVIFRAPTLEAGLCRPRAVILAATCCLYVCASTREYTVGYVCVHEADIWMQQPAPHPTKPRPDIGEERISRGRKEDITLLYHGMYSDNSNMLPYMNPGFQIYFLYRNR